LWGGMANGKGTQSHTEDGEHDGGDVGTDE
jgi:hypothetical protein